MIFEDIIFGPIHSRRLGTSLGVNLMPVGSKVCNFNCIYCECGFNPKHPSTNLPKREEVAEALEAKLIDYHTRGEKIDTITFAGNGEPTIHPQFSEIIDDTIRLRNEIFPEAKISVLSNATLVSRPKVFDALRRVDNNILKLDSAFDRMARLINQPEGVYSVEKVIESLRQFDGDFTLQTLFFSGEYKGEIVDNTTEEEVAEWLKVVATLRPKMVMIYTLDRPTPASNLRKASVERMNEIAALVERLGIKAQVNG